MDFLNIETIEYSQMKGKEYKKQILINLDAIVLLTEDYDKDRYLLLMSARAPYTISKKEYTKIIKHIKHIKKIKKE